MKILIIDDCDFTRSTTEAYLRNAGHNEIIQVSSAEEAFELLGLKNEKLLVEPIDLSCILMDIMMPGMDGIEASKRILGSKEYENTSIIMVTGSGDFGYQRLAFEAGAVDYIRKPFSEVELVARVNNVLRVRSEVNEVIKRKAALERLNEELQESNSALSKFSYRDQLTGLANQFHLKHQIYVEWRRAIRYKNPLSLILIDIDLFKDFGDVYGEEGVDECLEKIAKKLEYSLNRPADLGARIEIDKFTGLLPDTNQGGAVIVAENIKDAIQKLEIEHSSSTINRSITVSIGVTTLVPSGKLHPPLLFEYAEKALNRAKEDGRNLIRFFTPMKRKEFSR